MSKYCCLQLTGGQSFEKIQKLAASRRSVVYRNLVFFIPAGICNMWSVVSQHFREPKFTNFLYCFCHSFDVRPSLQWVSVTHQVLQTTMTWGVFMMCGLLLVSIAQSVASCLEILSEPTEINDQDNHDALRNLNWRLESYSRLNKFMKDFNELFKWQIFLQMAVIVVHLCIYVYRPLKYWNKIGTFDSIVSLADALFALFGINFSIHQGMGLVFERSKQFLLAFNKLMASASKSVMICWREPLRKIRMWKLSSSFTDHHHCYVEELQFASNEMRAEIEHLKLQASSCTAFGFEGGIFFIVRANIFLTMLYSVTTHIIIMLQLDV